VNRGRKQTREEIEKRIKNTNHQLKEEKRKQTFLEKYGCEYISQLQEVKDKLSIAHKGTKKPRTKEHQQKIIDSKIRNGTTKHKSETATKIRKRWRW
jgi:hypothetical protein